jgi:membrane associated rhomboid family serine protease
MRMGMGTLTPVVKRLLIANIAVFAVSMLTGGLGDLLYSLFQLDPSSLGRGLQLWRLITYQFLHDRGSIMHILFNMLGLFFLGPALERYLSSRRFLFFYLGCGAAGGLFYLLLVAVGFLPPIPMVGASGAILGMLAACAILFPQFVVIILFFPVPIRTAAALLTAMYVFFVLTRGVNAGGHAAHLAGMAAGALYVLGTRPLASVTGPLSEALRRRNVDALRQQRAEVDRILQKVHDLGIQSLSGREKRLLRRATRWRQRASGGG